MARAGPRSGPHAGLQGLQSRCLTRPWPASRAASATPAAAAHVTRACARRHIRAPWTRNPSRAQGTWLPAQQLAAAPGVCVRLDRSAAQKLVGRRCSGRSGRACAPTTGSSMRSARLPICARRSCAQPCEAGARDTLCQPNSAHLLLEYGATGPEAVERQHPEFSGRWAPMVGGGRCHRLRSSASPSGGSCWPGGYLCGQGFAGQQSLQRVWPSR